MTDNYSQSSNGHAPQPDEVDDDFFQERGGIPGISFNEKLGYGLNTEWSGVVVWIGPKRQAKEWNAETQRFDGPPKCYPNSNDPIWEKPVVIQCDQVQPGGVLENGNIDDGRRSIVYSGERAAALRKAMKDAGAGRGNLRLGDWTSIKHSGFGGRSGNKKLYTAQWAAAPEGGADEFFADQQQAQQPTNGNGHVSAPAPQPAQPPAQTSAPAAPPTQAPTQQPPRQPVGAGAGPAGGGARPPWDRKG